MQRKYMGLVEASIKSSGGEQSMISRNVKIAEKNDSVNWPSKKLIRRRKAKVLMQEKIHKRHGETRMRYHECYELSHS